MHLKEGSLRALQEGIHSAIAAENTAYSAVAPSAPRHFKGKGYFPTAGRSADAADKSERATQIAILAHHLQELPPASNPSDPIAIKNKLIINEMRTLIIGMSAGAVKKALLSAIDKFEQVDNPALTQAINDVSILKQHQRLGAYLAAQASILQGIGETKIRQCDFSRSTPLVENYYYPQQPDGYKDYALTKHLQALQAELKTFVSQNPVDDKAHFEPEKIAHYDARMTVLQACKKLLDEIPTQQEPDTKNISEVKRIWQTLLDNEDTREVIKNLKDKHKYISTEMVEGSPYIPPTFNEYVNAITTIVTAMGDNAHDQTAFLGQVNQYKSISAMALVNQAHLDLVKAEGYPDRANLLKKMDETTQALASLNRATVTHKQNPAL